MATAFRLASAMAVIAAAVAVTEKGISSGGGCSNGIAISGRGDVGGDGTSY